MSVDNLTTKVVNYTDGLTQEFSFPFKIFSANELQVLMLPEPTPVEEYPSPIELILNSDYTVAFNSELESGTVTTSYAWEAGYKIVIKRVQVIDQLEDISLQERFKLHDLEHSLDKLTLIVQNLDTEIQRTAKLAEDFQYPVTLPPPDYNKFLAWHPTKRGQLVNKETTVDLSNYYTIPQVDALLDELEQDLMILIGGLEEDVTDLEEDIDTINNELSTIQNYLSLLNATQVEFDDLAFPYPASNVQEAIEALSAASGESNTTSNVGTGEGLALPKDLVDLPFKSIKGDIDSLVIESSDAQSVILGLLAGDDGDSIRSKVSEPTIGSQTYVTVGSNMRKLATNGKGVIVATNGSGNIYRSADNGATWDTIAAGANQFVGVAYGKGVFVITGRNTGLIRYSTDLGLTWNTAALSGVGGGAISADTIVYYKGFFTIVSEVDVLKSRSSTGMSFVTSEEYIHSGADGDYRTAVGGGKIFLLDKAFGNLWMSTDLGGTWEYMATPPPPVNSLNLRYIAYVGGFLYVISSTSQVYRTKNGSLWSPQIRVSGIGDATAGMFSLKGHLITLPTGTVSIFRSKDGYEWKGTVPNTTGLSWVDAVEIPSGILALHSTGVLSLPFSVTRTLYHGPNEVEKCVLYATKQGTGATMGPPEGSAAAGSNTRRALNVIKHTGSEKLASLNVASRAVTILKSGLYRVTAWAKAYRTAVTFLNLEGVVASQFEGGIYYQGSLNVSNNTNSAEMVVNLDAIVSLKAGDVLYLRQYIQAAGVAASSLGADLSLPTDQIAQYAKLELELIG